MVYDLRNVWGAAYYLLLGAFIIACAILLLRLTVFDGFAQDQWSGAAGPLIGAAVLVSFGLISVYQSIATLLHRRMLVLDRHQGTIELIETGIRHRRSEVCSWENTTLQIRPTTLHRFRGPNWHGYTLFVEMPDKRFSLARSRNRDRLNEVACSVSEQVGLPQAEDGEPVEYDVGSVRQTE